MDAFDELVKQEVTQSINNSACVFSAPARIISVEGNQKYKVQLVTSDIQYTLYNFSGSDLYVGESVQIYYRNNQLTEQTAYIGASFTKDSGHFGGLQFRKLTQAEFDLITTKDENTVYYVINNGTIQQYLGDILVGGSQVEFDISNEVFDIEQHGLYPDFEIDNEDLIITY